MRMHIIFTTRKSSSRYFSRTFPHVFLLVSFFLFLLTLFRGLITTYFFLSVFLIPSFRDFLVEIFVMIFFLLLLIFFLSLIIRINFSSSCFDHNHFFLFFFFFFYSTIIYQNFPDIISKQIILSNLSDLF